MGEEGTVFVIFGATGDLTRRKLLPALYHLLQKKRLTKFRVIAVARRELSVKDLLDSTKPFIKNPDEKVCAELEKRIHYHQLDFNTMKHFDEVREELHTLRIKGYPNRIFYLATSPDNFEGIAHMMQKTNMTKTPGYARIVFEKPFGKDGPSSKKLQQTIGRIFNEDQIYRIDHYLGKELVGNIAFVRFTNRILEPLWNRDHIESVQIHMEENLGVGSRGGFYDEYGAIKDVVQNHALQLVALIAMEQPKTLSGNAIRMEKARVLKRTKVTDSIVGQAQGYRKEVGVNKKSTKETMAQLMLEIQTPRWKGVPFFIKAGKYLNHKETRIVIKFRDAKCDMLHKLSAEPNYLEIRVSPNEGIAFELNAKRPEENDVAVVRMDFCHSCVFGPNTPEGYENMLYDVAVGDQSIFVHAEEVAASWKIVDNIRRGKLYSYKDFSEGPKEIAAFNKKHKLLWKE